MPRGRPKTKQGAEQANGAAISKMEAVRRALAELGNEAKPTEIQPFVQSKFGIAMGLDHISTYKSVLTRKALGKAGTTYKPRAGADSKGGITLEDIKAVKDLADRLGADKVRQLADVLSK